MAVELRVLDAAGNVSEMLPDWSDLTFSQDMIDAGALTFNYPTRGGRNASYLTHGVQLAVLLDGIEPLNGRFTYFEGTGSRIVEADGGTAQYSCSSNLKRFDMLMLAPAFGSTNTSPNLAPYVFSNRTPGYIAITAIGNAMSRANQKTSGLPWLTHPIPGPLSATVDSSNTAWTLSFDVTFNPGDSVRDVLGWLTENGFAEAAMSQKSLRLYDPSKNGRDLTVGAHPVVLQTGRDFTEATYQTSSTDVVNALLVLGDADSCVWRFDQASINTYGYREGTFQVQGAQNTSAGGTLSAAGDAYLSTRKLPRWSYTYAVSAQYLEQSTSPLSRPFIDYQVGDTILILDGVENQPRRLRLLSATWPSARAALVNLTVSDWFAERDITLERRLKRLGG